MTDGQWRVLGLLAFLLALEAMRNPSVKGFFTGIVGMFKVSGS